MSTARNLAFAETKRKLTARYLTECRNQLRADRSAGRCRHAAHHDEAVARTWAEIRATDAIRHRVEEDILATGKDS